MKTHNFKKDIDYRLSYGLIIVMVLLMNVLLNDALGCGSLCSPCDTPIYDFDGHFIRCSGCVADCGICYSCVSGNCQAKFPQTYECCGCVTICNNNNCKMCEYINGAYSCQSLCHPSECETCVGYMNCVVCDGDPSKECCNGQCYDRGTQEYCNGTCCDFRDCKYCGYTNSCESFCNTSDCETCVGNGNCKVCGGDPNKACCNGQCYDIRTQGCCGGTIYDLTTQQCCDDIDPHYKCELTCKSCCNGSCCNISNCEICKNGSCVKAVPTNMRQTYVEDRGGTLHFEYAWDSTTGDLADLGNCGVREKVDYPGGNPYYWPSPPWYCSTPNPTLLPDPPIPATGGGAVDNHSPGSFATPYQAASFSATQVYQYHCGPTCCMADDDWETLLDIGPITRCVSGSGDLWRYSIIKSGAYAEIFPLP